MTCIYHCPTAQVYKVYARYLCVMTHPCHSDRYSHIFIADLVTADVAVHTGHLHCYLLTPRVRVNPFQRYLDLMRHIMYLCVYVEIASGREYVFY